MPTGNFGDMFAGYAAKRMGLPIDRLVIATNDNDILARTFESGVYEMRERRSPPPRRRWTSSCRRTSSGCCSRAPGRDAATVRRYMDGLKQSGSFTIETAQMARLRADFSAGRAT